MEILVTIRGEDPVIPFTSIIAHNLEQEEDIEFALKTYEADLFAFFGEMPEGTPPPKFPINKNTNEIDYDKVFLIPEQTFFLLSLISQTENLIEFRKKVIYQVREVRESISDIRESAIQDMFYRGSLEVRYAEDEDYDHFLSIYDYIEEVDPSRTVDEIWDGLGLMGYTDNLHRSHVEDPDGGPIFSENLIEKAIKIFAKEKNKNL